MPNSRESPETLESLLVGGKEAVETLRRLLAERGESFGSGHQGEIAGLELDGHDLVVKTIHGRGPARWVERWLLRREHRAYERLGGVVGVPRCFGLVGGEFLLLERVEATPYRVARIENRDRFHDCLLQLIQDLHARGVAHGDLKGKNNLLVGPGEQPFVVDFGLANVAKSGSLRPFHRAFHRLLAQMDTNAYIKIKYDRDYSRLEPEDEAIFRRTWPERTYAKIKAGLLRLRYPTEGLLPVKKRLDGGGRRPVGSTEASERLARKRLEDFRGKTEGQPRVQSGDAVAMLMFDGTYAEIEESGRLVARSHDLGTAALFDVGLAESGEGDDARPLRYGDRITFRSLERERYVVVAPGDRRLLVADGETAGEMGVFEIVPSEMSPEERSEIRRGEYFSFRSHDGWHFRYAADTDGEFTASSPRTLFWESLALVTKT